MMDPEGIKAIIDTYAKHGWKLRRVLLSPDNREALRNSALFAGADVVDAPANAMWFSRPSRPGTEAWEIRAITPSPFAILEVLDEGLEGEQREAILKAAEERLAARFSRPSLS